MENFLRPPDGILSDSNPAATPPHELASVSRLPQIGQPAGRTMQLLIAEIQKSKRQTDLKVHEPGICPPYNKAVYYLCTTAALIRGNACEIQLHVK